MRNNYMVATKIRNLTVGNRCPMCGKVHTVTVNKTDFERWQSGVSIQSAFPYLSANEREILISGTCPKCWDSMFSFGEEEEEEDADACERESLEYTGQWW